MSRQHHTVVDTWADLKWSLAPSSIAGMKSMFSRTAAVTNPVKGGNPLTVYQMSTDPDQYWIMIGPEFITKKGQTQPHYFDTIEAACRLYSWLHPEQKEPTDETDKQSGIHRSSYGYSAFSQRP